MKVQVYEFSLGGLANLLEELANAIDPQVAVTNQEAEGDGQTEPKKPA